MFYFFIFTFICFHFEIKSSDADTISGKAIADIFIYDKNTKESNDVVNFYYDLDKKRANVKQENVEQKHRIGQYHFYNYKNIVSLENRTYRISVAASVGYCWDNRLQRINWFFLSNILKKNEQRFSTVDNTITSIVKGNTNTPVIIGYNIDCLFDKLNVFQNLTKIYFKDVKNLPNNFINSQKKLKKLVLYDCVLENPRLIIKTPASLEKLIVDNSKGASSIRFDLQESRELKTLKLKTFRNNIELLNFNAQMSLLSLMLNLEEKMQDLESFLKNNLSSLINLQTLILSKPFTLEEISEYASLINFKNLKKINITIEGPGENNKAIINKNILPESLENITLETKNKGVFFKINDFINLKDCTIDGINLSTNKIENIHLKNFTFIDGQITESDTLDCSSCNNLEKLNSWSRKTVRNSIIPFTKSFTYFSGMNLSFYNNTFEQKVIESTDDNCEITLKITPAKEELIDLVVQDYEQSKNTTIIRLGMFAPKSTCYIDKNSNGFFGTIHTHNAKSVILENNISKVILGNCCKEIRINNNKIIEILEYCQNQNILEEITIENSPKFDLSTLPPSIKIINLKGALRSEELDFSYLPNLNEINIKPGKNIVTKIAVRNHVQVNNFKGALEKIQINTDQDIAPKVELKNPIHSGASEVHNNPGKKNNNIVKIFFTYSGILFIIGCLIYMSSKNFANNLQSNTNNL